MIGQTVSHYKIVDRLGSGGMGEVYLAEDTKLGREVALKFLPPSLWNEAEAQQRLIREAQAASKLDHPNIVTIFGIDEADGRPFISMSRVNGVSLKEYCTAERRTVDELVQLAVQIADGLQHAHESGVIHRDLKPSNILVDSRGRARILDFGIASLRGAARLTQTGSTLGTIAYAPPELAEGKQAEPASDIYSLGVVMYQMLCGRLPFEADHEAALLYSILHEQPQPLSKHRPDIPPALQEVITKCLAKRPQDRFRNSNELLEALRAAMPQACEIAAQTSAAMPSVAVLPFANMSADPENEYFSDGLTEELLNVLARNPELKVTGRTSSFAFKGKHEDLREIGQKLGVETVLEGSVRKAGNRVRITAQLIKSSDGFHLWSDTYDRVLDDIFAVQDDIAAAVSKALDVTLLGKKEAPTKVNAANYSLLLEARHFANRNTRDGLARAEELYKQVLAVDDRDARAWAGLTRVYMGQYGYGLHSGAISTEAIKEAADKTCELDDMLPEAWEGIAWIKSVFDFDWKGAEAAFQRAYDLAPGGSDFAVGLATIWMTLGRFDECLPLSHKAVELDPLNSFTMILHARNLLFAGKYAEARAAYRRALDLSPGIAPAHAMIGATYLMEGDAERAVGEIAKERTPGYRHFGNALAYWALGNKEEADKALKELESGHDHWAIQRACVYAYRGEIDKAFAELDFAIEIRDAGIPTAPLMEPLKSLHGDPRWTEFLDRIKYPKEYRK